MKLHSTEILSEDSYDRFTIYIFGVTDNGKSVCLKVKNFTPYFMIKIPPGSNFNQTKRNINTKTRLYSSLKVLKKKDADGFNNESLFDYIRLTFDSLKNYRIAKSKLQEFDLYDCDLDPMIVMLQIRKIPSCGWMTAKNLVPENDLSRCELNYSVNWTNLDPVESNQIPAIKIASFDIEAFSVTGGFPDATEPKNVITQIATIFFNHFTKESHKTIVVLGECDPLEDVEMIVCKTEEDLICNWIDLIIKNDPDIFMGYNIDIFDWYFIYERIQFNFLDDYFIKLSRLYSQKAFYENKAFKSKAYGTINFNTITCPGIVNFDLYTWFKKNKKLPHYSLEYVSSEILNEHKRPVTPKQIFEMSGPKGTPESRKVVADYCVQDTNLPIRLIEHLKIVYNYVEMAKVVRVPLTWLLKRGESITAYSLICYFARIYNYVIPKQKQSTVGMSYKGASVLSPKYGSYNLPVCGLDFKSLYPSIMISNNLCITTLVKDKKYLNIPGVEYKDFVWEGGNYIFVQNVEGLTVKILKELLGCRSEKKKLMATTKNEFEKIIYNASQLAYKLKANSVYGYFGCSFSALYCKPVSSTVTYVGRQTIDLSKSFAETKYNGYENDYSDSLVEGTLIETEDNQIPIEQLASEWEPFKQDNPDLFNSNVTKEQSKCDIKLMSTEGLTNIIRVLRHKTEKCLYKIKTKTKEIIATEDHSFICENLKYIRTKQLTKTIKLFECDPIISIENVGTTEKYVYDIETKSGTYKANGFFVKNSDDMYNKIAAKADVKYGDTDSIYTLFHFKDIETMPKEEALKITWELAVECSNRITETFKHPIELEMEKIMWPLYLYGKKKYANKCYELTKKGFKCEPDFKGIQIVRRDSCKLVKTICLELFDILLENKIQEGIQFIRDCVNKLFNNKYPIEEFILSKSLKDHYKTERADGGKLSLPAHVILVERLKERNANNIPNVGDRVQYAFVELENSSKKTKVEERVEDPDYIKEKNLTLDFEYYLVKQLASPLYTIFEILVRDSKGNVYPRKVKNDGTTEISKECKSAVSKLLWDDILAEYKKKKEKQRKLKGIQKFMKFYEKC